MSKNATLFGLILFQPVTLTVAASGVKAGTSWKNTRLCKLMQEKWKLWEIIKHWFLFFARI